MQIVTWIQQNYAQALQALAGLTIVLELCVRLFVPTSQALGFLARLGSVIQGIMDALKIPVAIKTDNGAKLVSPAAAQIISDSNAKK